MLMFHLVNFDRKTGERYIVRSFETENDMLRHFAASPIDNAYESFVRDQNLTGNDTRRYVEYTRINDELVESISTQILRGEQIIDDDGRVIDIRDYKDKIIALIAVNKTEPRHWFAMRPRRRWQKQGRTHVKSAGFHWHQPKLSAIRKNADTYADIESEIADNVKIKCRRKEKFIVWNDKFYNAENNWKSAKVRKQYMWHKCPSTVKDVRSFKYYNDNDDLSEQEELEKDIA